MITLYPQGLVWQKKTRAKQQTTEMPYSNLCARHYAETKPPGASTQSASRAGNILTDTWTLFSVQRLHGFPQLVQFSQILGHDPKASNDTAIWHGKRYFFPSNARSSGSFRCLWTDQLITGRAGFGCVFCVFCLVLGFCCLLFCFERWQVNGLWSYSVLFCMHIVVMTDVATALIRWICKMQLSFRLDKRPGESHLALDGKKESMMSRLVTHRVDQQREGEKCLSHGWTHANNRKRIQILRLMKRWCQRTTFARNFLQRANAQSGCRSSTMSGCIVTRILVSTAVLCVIISIALQCLKLKPDAVQLVHLRRSRRVVV